MVVDSTSEARVITCHSVTCDFQQGEHGESGNPGPAGEPGMGVSAA